MIDFSAALPNLEHRVHIYWVVFYQFRSIFNKKKALDILSCFKMPFNNDNQASWEKNRARNAMS